MNKGQMNTLKGPSASEQVAALEQRVADLEADYAALVQERDALAQRVTTAELWRCFHCDEVFTDRAGALEHFGSSELKTPACRLSADDVSQLRQLEQWNAELRAENERLENDSRLWHESQADRVRRIGHCEWWQELDSKHGEILVLKAERDALAQQVEALKQELSDTDDLNGKLAKLLTGVADALKGQPEPLTLHSWHDLPEKARYVVDCAAQALADATTFESALTTAQQDAARLREALEKVEAEATRVHDLAKTQAVVAAAEGNYQSAAATAAEAGGYAYLALYIKRIRERAALTAPADPTGGQ